MTSSEINDVFKTDIVSLFQLVLDRVCIVDKSADIEIKTIDAFCQLSLRMTEKSLRHVYGEVSFCVFV